MLAKLEPHQQTLLRAAEIIRERGWASAYHRTSGHCAHTAIGADGWTADAATAVQSFINHLGGKSVEDIWNWNDAPERTAAEVIKALTEAALT
jgi:hypothetical protein